jgi:uncharacterized protein YmfQ (DUF2313 family)
MDNSGYLSQLIGLLPPGDALVREPGSVLERLLSVPAAELARVDGRVEALLLESDPARTTEMLADWERALGLPDVCYPNFQFSRASRGWYFDGAGVLREAAVDEPRYLFDAQGNRTEAVLVEPEATNFVLQPYYQVGTSGQWIQAQGTAISSLTQNFAQSLEGLNRAARVRWVGPNNGDWLLLRFYTIGVPANTPSTISFWVFTRSLGNANFVSVDSGDFGSATGNLIDQFRVGAWSRVVGQVTPTPASLAWMDLNFLSFTIGEIDIDIWGVQVEAGTAATSLILPAAPATVGPTTRAADQLYVATIQERRQRILARLIERFEPTPAAIIGLAARLGDTVTLTEFRPHSCEEICEAPLLDEPWPHTFQITGASQVLMEFLCEDTVETPLSQWRRGAYECAVRRFAPAHSFPIFSYL